MTNNITLSIASWFFGFIGCAIGMINLFWGNDPFFGVFVLFGSLIFFPPVSQRIKQITGIRIPVALKILLAAFIIWASLGVGELFDKVDLMLQYLR